MAVIAIMAGMLLNAVTAAHSTAVSISCTNNLKELGYAFIMYEDAHESMPLGNLPVALKPFDGNRELYICPEDDSGTGDSYGPYYVCRGEQDTKLFTAGCHRHLSEDRSLVLYGMGTILRNVMEPVVDKSGGTVGLGEEVSTDILTFADGSTVKVTGSGGIRVLASCRESTGRLYTIVQVPRDHLTGVQSTVTPGSAFEVVTPSSIAVAWGTKYKVTTKVTAKDYTTDLDVDSGTVGFGLRRPGAKPGRTPAGKSKKLGLGKGKCPLN